MVKCVKFPMSILFWSDRFIFLILT
jgi:hypothetical protein